MAWEEDQLLLVLLGLLEELGRVNVAQPLLYTSLSQHTHHTQVTGLLLLSLRAHEDQAALYCLVQMVVLRGPSREE